VTGPTRLGVRRLLEAHGLRPDTDLGQHFLLDENLVDLSLRAVEVGPEDVVLEVGAGPGVLTTALARAAKHVHAIEIDRRLEPVLTDALQGHENIDVHWADALKLALEELAPAPTVFVANLPYSIATPIVLESMWRLPDLRAWCVMVQREVGDRWLAAPASPLYGAPSVVMQLVAEATLRRPVGREVFMPRPRVDSALIALRRIAQAPDAATRAFIRAGFAHRRKTLSNALVGAGADRATVATGIAALGLSPTVRAQDLTPAQFLELRERVPWTS
jgi:16S rRNA (adenine1518-N6/adenine1519-N6)-dimethyltransferase